MATPNLLALTSMTPGVLVSTKIATANDAAVFTVSAGHAVRITSASLSNNTGAAVACGVSIVQSGGTVGDGTHKVLPDGYSIPANDSQPLDLLVGAMLGDGDSIACHAGAANALDIVITGVVMA